MTDPTQLYLAAQHLTFPTSSDETGISSLYSTHLEIVNETIARLPARCNSFKTYSEHAEDIFKKASFFERLSLIRSVSNTYIDSFESLIIGRDGAKKMLAAVFEKMGNDGIFFSLDSLLKISKEKIKKSVPTPPIRSVGIITCNRPENLKKALLSYGENFKRWGRKVRIIVCDDSRTLETRDKNKQICELARAETGVDTLYFGLEEKESLARELIFRGIPESVVRFCLFDTQESNYSYGANCNSFFLLSAGELAFVTDDDTLCRLSCSPDFKNTVKLGSDDVVMPLWFFKNRESALDFAPEIDIDLLGLHEAYLGKNISQIISENPLDNLDLQNFPVYLMQQISLGNDRVLQTHNGLLGDSGSDSPRPFLFSKGDQRKRLLDSEESYRSAFESREHLKVAPQSTLRLAGPCMSTFYGLDNREPLPPYFPMYRDCDSLAGVMTSLGYHGAHFAYLPWALYHSPPENRKYYGLRNLLSAGLSATDAITSCLKTLPPSPVRYPFAFSLEKMGSYLKEVGEMPLSEFQMILAQDQKRKKIEELEGYNYLLKAHSKDPKFFKKDIKMIIAKLKEPQSRQIFFSNPPLINKLGLQEAEILTQLYVKRFGEMVFYWPKMFEAVLQMKKEGLV